VLNLCFLASIVTVDAKNSHQLFAVHPCFN